MSRDLYGTGPDYCPQCKLRCAATDSEVFALEDGQLGHVLCAFVGIRDLYTPARARLSVAPDKGPAT